MSNHVRDRAFPRGGRARRILATTVATLTALGTLSLSAAFADSGTYDITVSNTSGFATATTTSGAVVSYYGSASPEAAALGIGSSGTGVFTPFYRLQGSPTEAGYNTGGTPELDTSAGTWTHAIKVSEIPTVVVGGQRYLELYADINESNSTPAIDLTDMQVYFTGDPNLTGYPFPAASATEVYDFSGDIQIKDVNQGSGRADLRYLLPLTSITLPSGCNYGNAACSTYFVLYSKLGNADGGFEEWKVRSYPFVSVSTTATTSYTRTYGWGITKAASPTGLDMLNGQSGTSTWTVGVTKDAGTDSGWDVTGTITVSNPSNAAATIGAVTDVLSTDGNVTVDCGAVTFPTTLNPGDSLGCTYDKTLSGAHNQVNTASAVLDSGVAYDGSAAVTFGAPTTTVNGSVDVTDTNGKSWTFAGSSSVSYDQTFTCGADQGAHDNIATITQTGDSAKATVTVTCHAPAVVPLALPAVTCSTNATVVSLPVASNGQPDAKALQAAVQVSGLTAGSTMTVTAVLYGPSASPGVRSTTVAATQTFQAGNGTTQTQPVSVSKPGYYTWEITTTQSTQACGAPTLVHRADYAIAHVPTGFSGPVGPVADRAAPTTLTIAKLGIRALLTTAPLNHGSLAIPSPSQVGWVNKSASPTDLIGTTVLAGHVSDNHDRPGALYSLHKIRRGQIIVISGPGGVQKFKVTVIKKYSRSQALPKSLFNTTSGHRLVLISCTDKVIHGGFFHYTKNLVVIAQPIA